LGKSNDVVERLLNLFEAKGYISISEKNSAFYTIQLINIDNISELLNSSDYLQIYDMAEECEIFQHTLLEDDLAQII
jgi:hypothetical protein